MEIWEIWNMLNTRQHLLEYKTLNMCQRKSGISDAVIPLDATVKTTTPILMQLKWPSK